MESLKERRAKYKWHTTQMAWYEARRVMYRYHLCEDVKKWKWYETQYQWHRRRRSEILFTLPEIVSETTQKKRARIVRNIMKKNPLFEKIKNAKAL